MSFLRLIPLLAIVCIATSCDLSTSRTPDDYGGAAETAGPQFANYCISASQWPRLVATMRKFGAQHGLELHGGDGATGARLNVYLAQGYSYYFGDDFDLWFVDGPFRKDVVGLDGVLKRKPITPEQQALAKALMAEVDKFSRKATGPSDNPSCS